MTYLFTLLYFAALLHYDSCSSEICTTVCGMQGTPSAGAYDPDAIASFVKQLTDFDRRMNTVVVDAKILHGISQGQLIAAGEGPLLILTHHIMYARMPHGLVPVFR